MNIIEKQDLVSSKLGYPGRLLAGSKTFYLSRWPNNEVVFNSNLVTKYEKLWFGDLDLTRDDERLQNLANELGETFYIMREYDARFENEAKWDIDKAVKKYEPKN